MALQASVNGQSALETFLFSFKEEKTLEILPSTYYRRNWRCLLK